ncbi:hypothetical protein BDZ89DRAFT_1151969 [Hymenopellis radicata]|nr:hypothetical protein BDZ89DRAFT_1151969 [Hymenopellis radicata]
MSSSHAITDDCAMSIVCLLDGHGGHSTKQWLAPRLSERLHDRWWDLHYKTRCGFPWLYHPSAFHALGQTDGFEARGATPEEIADMMKRTFLEIDNDLVNLSAHLMSAKLARRWDCTPNISQSMDDPLLQAAVKGCSAIVLIYDHVTQLVHVANSGSNTGVILARPRDSGQQRVYDVEVLARPAVEDERQLRALHPDEDNLLGKNGWLWGCSPLRVFGHAPWKWTKDVRQMIGFTDLAHDAVTPPYVTAEPITATARIENGDILIMASRGVFPASFSPEATVRLVQDHLDLARADSMSAKVLEALGWIAKEGDSWAITDKVVSGEALSLGVMLFKA